MFPTLHFQTKDDFEYMFVVSTLGENPNFRMDVYTALDLVRAKRVVTPEGQPCMFNFHPQRTNWNLYNARITVYNSTSTHVDFLFKLDLTYQANTEHNQFLIRVIGCTPTTPC